MERLGDGCRGLGAMARPAGQRKIPQTADEMATTRAVGGVLAVAAMARERYLT